VCLSAAAACLHYCTDPDVTWSSGRGCPLIVHYWADLQSVHGSTATNLQSQNNVIDWANAKVTDRESDKAGRLIREATWIRKTDNMNRDEGSYQLSHVWDKLLHTDDRHWKSVLMKVSDVKPKRR